MKYLLAIAMLVLFCGCKDSVPPKVLRYRDYSYVRLDVIQEKVGKEGITFYLKPPEESK